MNDLLAIERIHNYFDHVAIVQWTIVNWGVLATEILFSGGTPIVSIRFSCKMKLKYSFTIPYSSAPTNRHQQIGTSSSASNDLVILQRKSNDRNTVIGDYFCCCVASFVTYRATKFSRYSSRKREFNCSGFFTFFLFLFAKLNLIKRKWWKNWIEIL